MTVAIGTGVRPGSIGVLLTASMLAGCIVGPNLVRPTLAPPPAATVTSLRGDLAASTPLKHDWWTAFGDPALDAIEVRVLGGNLDIHEAGSRVQRSRAALRIAGADSRPRAGAAASYMRECAGPRGILGLIGPQAPAPDAAGGGDPFGTTVLPGANGASAYDLFQAGVDASWEVDLWGRNRRNREAARAMPRPRSMTRRHCGSR